MVEGTDTVWLAVLEKKGLHQAAGILENYGIDSETDVSLLDQGDLRNLVSQGFKPMQLKKLERWCDAVRPRVEKTLPSSLNTPTAAALLSSEALNVLTLPAPCATVTESVSDNEGECDGEEDGGELRAVLTNSPNSCPPERLFSIFNATYNDDQKRSHTDYIELSMQSQFNKRAL